ncbi:fimbrillin family protein [Prevotella sp. Rep29]|jgi:hypothetical protein|uniref:fimbrillin family protein n=1 Tax=Prevotella sp. Rep29 TaxID=2691580 RepID=UPI001C6ED172|nr:fimbrillin family protein [Prevotella sp. Rep29]QYR09790.1 hypothetical protein GRF55_01050 [Prevotella sp. Rep29]
MLKRFGMFLLCLSALWACTDDDVTVVEQNDLDRMVEITINAGVDAEGSTRTFIAASGDNFWKVGDSIGVWVLNDAGSVVTGPQPYKFKVTEVKSDQTKCTLQGKVPAQYENNRLAAIYPYQADATLEKVDKFNVPCVMKDGYFDCIDDENYKYLLTANVPTVQKAVKGSYDPEAYISIAVMNEVGTDLNFRNACTLIKFTAPSNTGKTITSVKFESRNETELDEQVNDLTGRFEIAYCPTEYGYSPAGYNAPNAEMKNFLLVANMKPVGANTKSVTLEAPEGFEPGATYYMVVKSFISNYEMSTTLPETGGGNWVDPQVDGVIFYSTAVPNPLRAYDENDRIINYTMSESPTPLDDITVNVSKGYPLLKSGHILYFTASDGTVCTRKFKASSTVETTEETLRAVKPSELVEGEVNYWYWVTRKTITTTSGLNFERNTYKPLTFADNSSNWSGKFQ